MLLNCFVFESIDKKKGQISNPSWDDVVDVASASNFLLHLHA